jgi:hypothetical protein
MAVRTTRGLQVLCSALETVNHHSYPTKSEQNTRDGGSNTNKCLEHSLKKPPLFSRLKLSAPLCLLVARAGGAKDITCNDDGDLYHMSRSLTQAQLAKMEDLSSDSPAVPQR